ncbi:NADPH-quinone reductase [Streptomyces rimosus subsp. rimosus]|uniref:NADP-dependent oxidoreductase n=2 Tax=Streptomyces rimosus subsp. rimosus TaxID=132474 RepID=A0A8A1UZW6_STRR1|nr:NADPH-quinone reductase [Kitasatospora aureofaciens]KOT36455.1 NADPH-quinone reductase [Streptomyces sp. NRRL WC-3701]KOT45106.1 NADPH-quinone reductase [Streptomyces rimosus subsp. rimosus]MYT47694.1 zinc-binding dehydrogenase [Streptomyces sp. SID5471]QDA04953.1 NADP-dependent oxidoreductase [Streptomyces rimosus]QGY71840.1 zinc-binding dehydrogenase [Streptomyces rimosus R6-500]QST86143.1 NADP-dependent oxidoreductase [Streptomyces rimosus subsp. rimosus ATCC 10970]
MRAIQLHEHGGPEVLRYDEVPVPEPGPGEVLVRVHAVGINPPDWYLRDGLTNIPPETRPEFELPVIPGTDVSGVVETVAADVEDFSVGDEVFGLLRFPSFDGRAYAEYVAAPASDLARKPAGIDHVHAAGAPMSLLTAWQFLIEVGHDHPSPFQAARHRPVALGAGTTVLVNGAAGGVGHFALQLAKWKGAQVIAVASGAHESFLRDLGADEFIDYTKSRPEELASGVDLVLDAVGGHDSSRLLRTLKRGGALFPVFFGEYDEEETTKLGVTVSGTQVRSNGAQLAEVGRLLDAGTVRVAIDSTYPLADAQAAHERASRGHIQGKIVLKVA